VYERHEGLVLNLGNEADENRDHFDADVRDIVKVKIIHGFWKNEDERRIALLVYTIVYEHFPSSVADIVQETAERYANIQLISAYMPDPFGTHHTKMLILFRHDDLAQVVIHTANMIKRVCKPLDTEWTCFLAEK
jgi:tyrosyl-DNA phosphodiesterase-1